MWRQAYATTNQRAPDNPYTPGQCGGMCGVWLANMFKRTSLQTLAQTRPHSRVATETHLAGLSVPAHRWQAKKSKLQNLQEGLAVADANMRYVAAAGLKPGRVRSSFWLYLSNGLGKSKACSGYFIDIGAHAVATFVNGNTRTWYEIGRRIYFFDPNHGCYYSDDDASFSERFEAVYQEHSRAHTGFRESNWDYFRVFDVRAVSDADTDIDISSLFG